MKRISFIVTFLFITASIFYHGSKAYGYDLEGLYIAPKVVYYPENPTNKDWNHYAGGGLAVGFDLFRLKEYPIPMRVELEYVGRVRTDNTRVTVHTAAVGIYYDFNLFYVRASELETLSTKSVYTLKRPFMSVYLGVNVGARIRQISGEPTTIGLMQSSSGTTTIMPYIGLGVGFVWHATSWFAIDLGYRFVLGNQQMFGYKSGHDVLLSFRFTKP